MATTSDAFTECAVALETHLSRWDDLPSGGVAWENSRFIPPSEADTLWVRVNFQPNVATRRTAGDNGYSRIEGMFSIVIMSPEGGGGGAARQLADSLVRRFRSGTDLASPNDPDVKVTVQSAFAGAGATDDYGDATYFQVPVFVVWYTHVAGI